MKQTKKKPKKSTAAHKVHRKQFLKVYWPYIPLLILVLFGMTFGYGWNSPQQAHGILRGNVLAYATEMSVSGLLSATNYHRGQNGSAALALNDKLIAAAQAKANDMVTRNYWSHNTPDGKEPWIFIDATGYQYQKAGENLAYGFDTSSATVIGWMNSPSHRANMLDNGFTEVGFGYANSASYVGSGEETVVVAMYARPLQVSASPTVQSQTASPTPTPTPTPQTPPTPAAPPAQAPAVREDTIVPAEPDAAPKEPVGVPAEKFNQPVTTETPIPLTQESKRITRLQTLTGGLAPWSATALTIGVVLIVGAWLFKHVRIVKRVLVDGEHFVMHHPVIDVIVLSVVAIAIILSQSSGVVK